MIEPLTWYLTVFILLLICFVLAFIRVINGSIAPNHIHLLGFAYIIGSGWVDLYDVG